MKHHNSTQEVLKHLKEIVIPYVEAERKKFENPDQFAPLIWDVFQGQKTEEVTSLLRENNVVNEYVPNNMTADFQVLDLIVSNWVKVSWWIKLNNWFAETLRKELDPGKPLDEISIKFKLTTMKPLHAKWEINVFNQLSSFEGKKVILDRWKALGILDALGRGLAGFSGSFCSPVLRDRSMWTTRSAFQHYIRSELVEKERIFSAIVDDDNDNDGELLPGAISSSDDSGVENDEEIENN